MTRNMQDPIADEYTPIRIVDAPLKKLRGCRDDLWNHRNPEVDVSVKMTPHRPAFEITPEEDCILPEVHTSPFQGIPADEYVKNVISIESSDEDDFYAWRIKEEEDVNKICNTEKQDLTADNKHPDKESTADNKHPDKEADEIVEKVVKSNTIATTSSKASVSKNIRETRTTSSVASKKKHKQKQNSKIDFIKTVAKNLDVFTAPDSWSHVSSNDSVPSSRASELSACTSKLSVRCVPVTTTSPNADYQVPSNNSTISTSPNCDRSLKMVIKATPKLVSEVERIAKGMGAVKQLKKRQKDKNSKEKSRKHRESPPATSDDTAEKIKNNGDSTKEVDDIVTKLLDSQKRTKYRRKENNQDGVDYIIPKKKPALRSTAIHQIKHSFDEDASEFIHRLNKLHEKSTIS